MHESGLPEGSEADGDHEWDAGSYCRCPDCDHDGIVADFRQTVSDAERTALAKSESERPVPRHLKGSETFAGAGFDRGNDLIGDGLMNVELWFDGIVFSG